MNQRFDMKTLFAIIIIVLLIQGFTTMDRESLLNTLYSLPGLVLAITVHEYFHARTSDKYGDPTPERQGRLTLNPLAHLDPVGTICLLFAGFGWGKPVEIDPTYYRNPAKESMKVALAGPLSNFVLALIMTVIFGIGLFLTYAGIIPANNTTQLILMLIWGAVVINISLGVFNLLPFPPLDGSKIYRYFLKGKAKEFLYTMERYSTIIILILFITEIPAMLITPVINALSSAMLMLVELMLNVLM